MQVYCSYTHPNLRTHLHPSHKVDHKQMIITRFYYRLDSEWYVEPIPPPLITHPPLLAVFVDDTTALLGDPARRTGMTDPRAAARKPAGVEPVVVGCPGVGR